MFRLPRSAGAVLLAVTLCLGTSAGPVLADDQPLVEPAPAPTSTTTTSPPSTAPTESAPSSEPAPPGLEPSPPEKPAVQEMADLRLRVWFEEPSYEAHEPITAHASVTNVGTAGAGPVVVTSTGNMSGQEWRPFHPYGVTIEPGQTVEGTATGLVTGTADVVRLVVTAAALNGEPDGNPEDNTVSVSVSVLFVRGGYRGTVYGDADGDHALDPGEGLAGLELTVTGGNPYTERTTTTNENGAFQFRDLPAGRYLSFVSGWAWYTAPPPVNVNGRDDPDVLIRGVRRVWGELTTTLVFTPRSYQAGDVARAALTLHNAGTVLLSDLTADCHVETSRGSAPADVGELAPGGPGVVLPSGATREFGVTAPVTLEMASRGHVRLWCSVGAPPVSNDTGALVGAVAHVAGGIAPKVTGFLGVERYQQGLGRPSGAPLPGVKVYLRDQVDEAVVARATSGSDGAFTFYNVPAGLYSVGVVGPWVITYGTEMIVQSGENGSTVYQVLVRPGPDQPDPDAVSPGGGGDAAPPPPVLASTGVGITWLALGGVMSLVAGCALLLGTSPRRVRP